MSGNQGPSITCLRRGYSDFTLDARLHVRGSVRVIWGYEAPLGPDRPASDATLHPLSLTRHQGLDLGPDCWRIVAVDAQGKVQVVSRGKRETGRPWEVTVRRQADGATTLALDGKEVWKGSMSASRGAIGLLAEPHSYVSVDRFVVAGRPEPARLAFLYTEGWLGAGENPAHWVEQKDATFRFGAGAVRREEGGRAKWNFLGSSCTLWSPKGPDYGKVEVRLDGDDGGDGRLAQRPGAKLPAGILKKRAERSVPRRRARAAERTMGGGQHRGRQLNGCHPAPGGARRRCGTWGLPL